ncbi:conserved Plasmodium protein, unknown function [Plasmodium berghei]|uniref:Uncharacterized protein n=2 Tax=Plasmodium berghei TaxID=5821 RepID=A0A509AP18_PLABA|nr:conserved protein, unknown function [Plasmodium berghei ANKA]CXI83023.1 conserved Plasmodium protein, unknown function [Plasmodium berghei]SCM25674.1 conserved Plasmodium protein, unknown function [Plasmodium berghei]SCN27447.1 conserved Plasmodium protein, unknown function [Plasmodium berghei]SCO62147.1 conserved Plasmodium protein, unknown function [Plasmodium berghei]SCO63874.1 conserved Plasmodium protein, unknown function [Plasmodium berghei]|eukprot:XP_034423079.1 conserved protein, unknown function [Plasmodium berghei ANKA]
MLLLKLLSLLLVISLKCLMAHQINTRFRSFFLHTQLSSKNNNTNIIKQKRDASLYAVPKKKSSHRDTRRRKVAWMKKNPAKLYRTSSYDMDEIMRYTDRKLTSHYTTRDNWLNLPSTTLINDFFLFREIRN